MPDDIFLADTAVFTLLQPDKLEPAMESGELTFVENRRWVKAKEMLDALQAEPNTALPVLLGDASESANGVLAWGLIKKIDISTRKEETRVQVTDLRFLEYSPLFGTLELADGRKHLENHHQRPYALVRTPEYLTSAARTFLLTWKPSKSVSLDRYVEEFLGPFQENGLCDGNWSTGKSSKPRPGDRFLFLKQGNVPRGIVGSGWVRSYAWDSPEWGKTVDVSWNRLLDADQPLEPTTLSTALQKGMHWTPQSSGTQVPEAVEDPLWQAWDQHWEQHGPQWDGEEEEAEDADEPEDTAASEDAPSKDPVSGMEGDAAYVCSQKYERDARLRNKCLSHHGMKCKGCDMSFEGIYGAWAREFIHVHHLNPIAARGGEATETDAEKDLVPVCPNCHAMLHYRVEGGREKVRSLTVLRLMIQTARKAAR